MSLTCPDVASASPIYAARALALGVHAIPLPPAVPPVCFQAFLTMLASAVAPAALSLARPSRPTGGHRRSGTASRTSTVARRRPLHGARPTAAGAAAAAGDAGGTGDTAAAASSTLSALDSMLGTTPSDGSGSFDDDDDEDDGPPAIKVPLLWMTGGGATGGGGGGVAAALSSGQMAGPGDVYAAITVGLPDRATKKQQEKGLKGIELDFMLDTACTTNFILPQVCFPPCLLALCRCTRTRSPHPPPCPAHYHSLATDYVPT